VLANEEVKDGRYVERGDPVERRPCEQWMLKITEYAERLLDDLDDLDWPESVKEMQRNWIGRSRGAEVDFAIDGHDAPSTVFTTRPDTLFGATYMVLAPEHPLVERSPPTQSASRRGLRRRGRRKSDLDRTDLAKDKTGVFTGATRSTRSTAPKIPIWIADYVLMGYGTGAIMAVPGHDERDWSSPRLRPAHRRGGRTGGDGPSRSGKFTDNGEGTGELNSDASLDGLPTPRPRRRSSPGSVERGLGGQDPIQAARLAVLAPALLGRALPRDPAPTTAITSSWTRRDLPVALPEVDEFKPTGDGRAAAGQGDRRLARVDDPDGRKARARDQHHAPVGRLLLVLPALHRPAQRRERLVPKPSSTGCPSISTSAASSTPCCTCSTPASGTRCSTTCGLVSTKEPFQKLFNQGMILAYSYKDARGKYHHPSAVEERDGHPVLAEPARSSRARSRRCPRALLNVVNPDDVVAEYGADAMRLYELFMGPLEVQKPWQMSGVEGVYRFLQRVWRLAVDERTGDLQDKLADAPADSAPELNSTLHKTIKKVTGDTETLQMNTAISQMMIFVNEATSADALPKEILEGFLRVLAPYAPHLCEELWSRLGHEDLIAHAEWPVHDEASVPGRPHHRGRPGQRQEAGRTRGPSPGRQSRGRDPGPGLGEGPETPGRRHPQTGDRGPGPAREPGRVIAG
jgi:leucyl-tRNA synthetase